MGSRTLFWPLGGMKVVSTIAFLVGVFLSLVGVFFGVFFGVGVLFGVFFGVLVFFKVVFFN